jgi:hypothetical protein
VIVPDALDLDDTMRAVRCRTDAERATLRHALSVPIRNTYDRRIRTNTEAPLFHAERLFVEKVDIVENHVIFHFPLAESLVLIRRRVHSGLQTVGTRLLQSVLEAGNGNQPTAVRSSTFKHDGEPQCGDHATARQQCCLSGTAPSAPRRCCVLTSIPTTTQSAAPRPPLRTPPSLPGPMPRR